VGANFPGAGNALPDSYVEIVTRSRGASVPSGNRFAVIMGEGQRELILVTSALGGGNDGLDGPGGLAPPCTTESGSDGRHFLLPDAPLISNRTSIIKNGIPLAVLEGPINTQGFDSDFGAKVDIATGCVELQAAHIVDQGGQEFQPASNNIGNGTLSALELVDDNAPTETWTVRCSSVRRDGYGNPIDGYAKFIANGTVSGFILDGYGQQIVWTSNGSLLSNGILEFAVDEGATPFEEGDSFVIFVQGGALNEGDTLSAQYIAVIDINDPVFFTDMDNFRSFHGAPTINNTLALGAQILMQNGAPGFFALQTAPPLPRRQSVVLVEDAPGESDLEDLEFPLPLNLVPDADLNINFFITNPVTNKETQIIPNKVPFYNPIYNTTPAAFVFGPDVFSYTVVETVQVTKQGVDGVLTTLTPLTAKMSSVTVGFDAGDTGFDIQLFNSTNPANDGVFTVTGVLNGELQISRTSGSFIGTETSVDFRLINPNPLVKSTKILFTQDLALDAGEKLRATIVDVKDADFFDVGWTNAYASAEKIEVDMVVPLPRQTISAIFQNGKTHVRKMSTIKNKHERMLFIGAIKGLDPAEIIGTQLAAVEDIGILEGIQGDDIAEILAGDNEDLTNYSIYDNFGNTFRVVYMYPDEVVVQAGANRLLLDGFYMAPAAAGFFAGTSNVTIPLTRKNLTGFQLLRNMIFPPIILEEIAAAGACLMQPIAGGGVCLWGRTTTASGFAEEEEISIVFIRDRIAKILRAAFRGFIGQPESPDFGSTLAARINSVLIALTTRRLITRFTDVVVQRDPVEPRQWNIGVSVQPTYPVNWIYIRVDLGLI